MESKNTEKHISSRHIVTAVGFLLFLLGILFVLCPRTHLKGLSYVFEYPFGLVGQYFCSAVLLYLGIRIIFREHFYRFSIRAMLGLIVAFLGFMLLFSTISYPTLESLGRDFHTEFTEFAYLNQNGGLFGDIGLGGGATGYYFATIFCSINIILSYAIASALILLGFIIVCFPLFVIAFKRMRTNAAIAKAQKAEERRIREELENNLVIQEMDEKIDFEQPIPVEESFIEPKEEEFHIEEEKVAPSISFDEEEKESEEKISLSEYSFQPANEFDIKKRKDLRDFKSEDIRNFKEVSPNSVEIPTPDFSNTRFDKPIQGLHLAQFNENEDTFVPTKNPESVLRTPVLQLGNNSSNDDFNEVIIDNVGQEEIKEVQINNGDVIEYQEDNSFLGFESSVEEAAPCLEEDSIEEISVNEPISPQNLDDFVLDDKEIEEVYHEESKPVMPEIKPVMPEIKPEPVIEKQVHVEEKVELKPQPIKEEKPVEEVDKGIDPVSGMRFAKPRKKYIMPSIDLLSDPPNEAVNLAAQQAECDKKSELINEVFNDLGIKASVVSYTIGPSVTRYNISTSKESSVTSINKVLTDISVRLGGETLRFSEVVPGLTTSGMEIKNNERRTVYIKELMKALPTGPKYCTYIPFGMDISGQVKFADLADFPHLLVAGRTGSGKSIFLHGILTPLIMRNRPDDLKLLLIDPKKVEMARYAKIPHLLCPIVKDAGEAKVALEKLIEEMEFRYSVFDKCGYSTMAEYNEYYAKEHNTERFPYIICVIEEFADLVEQNRDVSSDLLRLASKARSAGIHLIVATQRPDVKVISGTIKANLGVRVALTVSSAIDSQTIIGKAGAEELCMKGDMLIDCLNISKHFIRAQGCFITRPESNKVTDFISAQMEQEFNPRFLDLRPPVQASEPLEVDYSAAGPTRAEMKAQSDADLFKAVCLYAITEDFMSISKIQRAFPIGFNRAGKVFARLQEEGIISSTNDALYSNKGHKVLIHSEEELNLKDEERPSVTPSF